MGFQSDNLNLPFQHIDKLQIFMPVHDLKAEISRINVAIHHIQYKIGKGRKADDLYPSLFITYGWDYHSKQR